MERARLRLWPALAAAAALHWPLFLRPLADVDEATYASVAALCNAGGHLYGDGGVDNKFPGIFWTYQALFGVAGRYAMTAVHLAGVGAVLATMVALGRLGRRLGGARAGFWAALLYGVFSLAYYPKMMAANTEQFMLPLLAASVLALIPETGRPGLGRLAGAGALIAAACLYKQVAAVNLAVVLAALVLPSSSPSSPSSSSPERPRAGRVVAGALACGLGFVAVFALAAAALAAAGTLGDAVHWTLRRVLTHYGPSAWAGSGTSHLGDAVASIGIFAGTALPLCVAAGLRLRRRLAADRLIVVWLAASALGVTAGGHFFGHYFLQLAAPLALLGGLGIAARPARVWGVAVASFGVVLMGLGMVFDPLTDRLATAHPAPDYATLARAVAARTGRDERIFVWGNAPAVYVLADRLPATRFVGFLRGLHRGDGESPAAAWDAGPEVWPLLAADFARHPPALVVDTSSGRYESFAAYPLARFPAVEALVRDGWVADGAADGVTLYRRR